MLFPSRTMLLVLFPCSVAALTIALDLEVRAQAVNLQALGIDAGFELPDLGGNDGAEQNNLVGFGPGWTFTELAGEITDWGVQDPGAAFFTRVADTPDNDDLAAPLQGRQIGFVNLNTNQASAELVSLSVGKLLASTNYTLSVGVGIRQNQAAWTVDYEIGLRTLGETDLGTFATVNKTNLSLPEDLVYNLNVGAAHPNIGQEVSIVIRSTNATVGDVFSQSAFDNVRLNGAFGAANTPFLTINRGTGVVTLSKTGTNNLSILGYSLQSEAGALNGAPWTEVGGTWSVVSNAADDLSEAQLSGGAPIALSNGSPRNFGNVWRRTPFEDITAELLLSDGSIMSAVVQYTGAEIPFGDLTGDGAIGGADWTAFKAGQGSSFAGLLDAQSYLLGDLDDDGDHDLSDFIEFRTAYDDANGLGAFAAMVTAVPEPNSLMLTMCGALTCAIFSRKDFRNKSIRSELLTSGMESCLQKRRLATWFLMTAIAASLMIAEANRANAQTIGPIPVPNHGFQDPFRAGDGNPDDEDAFDIAGGNAPPTGWTLTSSVNQNYGQQRPDPQSHFTRDVTGGETAPFTAGGFDGDLILFANLNTAGANFQADSSIVSQFGEGNYTLTVALGGRNTGSWNDLNYTIGLVGNTSGVVGTPTAVTINPANADMNSTAPTNSPWTTNDYNVVDVTYNFNVPTGSGLIGEDFFVRITAENSGFHDGLPDTDFAQAAIDNVRLVGPTVPLFGLYVDPVSGQVQLRNPTDSDIELSSYRITSGTDSLNEAGWRPIANQSLGAFAPGNGSGNGWEAGAQTDDGELVEWYLQGDSTLPGGSYLDLGIAFDALQGDQNLSLQYTNAAGAVVSGLVYYQTILPGDFDFDGDVDSTDLTVWQSDYGDFRNGRDFLAWQRNFGTSAPLASATAVPEPASAWLLLAGLAGLVIANRHSQRQGVNMTAASQRGGILFALLVGLSCTQSVSAATTVDRDYQFGDDVGESADPNTIVGSGNGFGTTFDSSNIAGFRDLLPEGNPSYVDVSPTNLARPGTSTGALGIEFNGTNYLRGLRFNDPETAPGSIAAGGTQDYAGITNRGFQLWIKPSQTGLDGNIDQYVVHDTSEHGLKIDGDETWIMIYDGGEHDSGIKATSDWAHVMVVRPYSGQNNFGGSLLYVNGIAIEGEAGPYDVTPEPTGESQYVLTVGTDSGNGQTDLISGANQLYSGVVDDLTFFAVGTTTNGLNLGKFNFGTDNGWATMHLSGVAGDVDQNGALDPIADANALVAGWGSENLVDGIYAGDMTTILEGDLNFDGRTNLADAYLLHQALLAEGFSAGFDFSLLQHAVVPEPTAMTLAVISLTCNFCVRKSRSSSLIH